MDGRQQAPRCPDCDRRLTPVKLEPPPSLRDALPELAELPDLLHCPECLVEVMRGHELAECPKLFIREGDELRLAPDVAQWIVADWDKEE